MLPGVAEALLPSAVHQLLQTPDTRPEAPNTGSNRVSHPSGLGNQVQSLLRTPTSQLATNGGSQHPAKRRAGGHQPTLADEVEHLLPTPSAQNSHGNANRSDGSLLLPGVAEALLPTPNATDGQGGIRPVPGKRTHRGDDHGPRLRDAAPALLPTPQVADVTGGHRSRSGARSDEPLLPAIAEQIGQGDGIDWGPYASAVRRWAEVTGRMPPSPVEPGRKGKHRLSPAFVEFMMGLPHGWVTGVPGLSRNAKLKILGNGVVPQQALLALRLMLPRVAGARRSAA